MATPHISKIVPASGPGSGGTAVVISGSGFTGATGVNFGAQPAAIQAGGTDTEITVASPAAIPIASVVDVSVTTPAGTSSSVSADQFTYLPIITGLSPLYDPTTQGQPVTITGSGFTGATSVNFGDQATAFTVVNDSEVTCTSPPFSPSASRPMGGTVDVTVTTTAGTSQAMQFTYDVTAMMTLAALAATAATALPWGETQLAQQQRMCVAIAQQLTDTSLATGGDWELVSVGLSLDGANMAYLARNTRGLDSSPVIALAIRGTMPSLVDITEDLNVGAVVPFGAGAPSSLAPPTSSPQRAPCRHSSKSYRVTTSHQANRQARRW